MNHSLQSLRQFFHPLRRWLADRLTSLHYQAIIMMALLMLSILALTVGATFLAYQRTSQVLAESRDRELARLSADRLTEDLIDLARNLRILADLEQMRSGEPTIQEQVLDQGRELIIDFINQDAGVVILDANGFVSVTRPFRPDLIGKDHSQQPYFQQARAFPYPDFFFSDILQEPTTGENMIVIAAPIVDASGKFVGVLTGRFYLAFQRLGQEIQKLSIGDKGYAYLIDKNGTVIYHPVAMFIGRDFTHEEAVQQLRRGRRLGALTTQTEPRTVEGYATVEVTGWGLVIVEPWEQVVQPAVGALRPVAVVLVVGLIMVALVVSVGVQSVTDPIQNLVVQTRQVATGDYDTQVTLSRIKEIKELGTAFNEMVAQISRYRAGIRQYVADIIRSQEEERKRIARDLHDDTVQSLVAINQRLELVKTQLDDPQEARNRLNEVKTMVTGAIASVRQFSRDLRPLALEDLGLSAAMQYLVNQLAQNGNVQVEYKVEGEPGQLTPDMEVALYRILQEALNNIRKHARARRVVVQAGFLPHQITLTVRDDGQGFEVPEALTDFASSGHFGIMGIQERVQLFGGQVSITSAPGEGTTLELVIPRQPTVLQFDLSNLSAASKQQFQ